MTLRISNYNMRVWIPCSLGTNQLQAGLPLRFGPLRNSLMTGLEFQGNVPTDEYKQSLLTVIACWPSWLDTSGGDTGGR